MSIIWVVKILKKCKNCGCAEKVQIFAKSHLCKLGFKDVSLRKINSASLDLFHRLNENYKMKYVIKW
jgi:hypothetical protein